LGKNIIEDIGIVHHTKFLDLFDNPEVIPELKERCLIEGDYILTTAENYKLITLFRLYSCIYHYNQFKEDNYMVNLYVKYKVVEYRWENTTSLREEIDIFYQKIHNKYKNLDCFKKIEEHYKNFNGVHSM
jgi:hypothetical protein